MRQNLEADSDETYVALFDPQSLPPSFSETFDRAALLAAAEAGQLLFALDASARTGIEGENVWSLFVDERPSSVMLEYAESQGQRSVLEVSSGRLWFASVEWLRNPEGLSRSSPPEATSVDVLPGRYRASVRTIAWPDQRSLTAAHIRAASGRLDSWASSVAGVVLPLAWAVTAFVALPLLTVGGAIEGGPTAALRGFAVWLALVAGVASVTAALWRPMRRSGEAWREASHAFPDAVVQLERIDGSSSPDLSERYTRQS